MKCRKCGGTAVINMRQHKLALCAKDYATWLPEQVQRRTLAQQRGLVGAVGDPDRVDSGIGGQLEVVRAVLHGTNGAAHSRTKPEPDDRLRRQRTAEPVGWSRRACPDDDGGERGGRERH